MGNTIVDVINSKFRLHKISICPECGGTKSDIVAISNTEEELKNFCLINNYTLQGSNPSHIIEKHKSGKKLFDFEPPIFLKASLTCKSSLEFKELFEDNITMDGLTVICDVTNDILRSYMTKWTYCICNPATFMATYLGLCISEHPLLYFRRRNHTPVVTIGGDVYELEIKVQEFKDNKAYLELIPIE